MEPRTLSDEAILRGLNAHPQIKKRIASMLAVVEDAGGDLKLADAAEIRLIEEIRRMGQEAMQAWADRQVERSEQNIRQSGQVHREGKKTLLAHPRRRHRGNGTPIPKATQRVRPFDTAPRSSIAAAPTTRRHRLWCGRGICASHG